MARTLTQLPPSSTVARLLDAEAAARATSGAGITVDKAGAGPVAGPLPSREPAIKRELTLNQAENETLERVIEMYRRATGARLSASHVARSMLRGVAHCLPSLQHEASRIGRLKLPSNARGREHDRELFENRIARAFVAGVRAAAAFEAE